mgnify:CR=1 FL=1
MLYFILSLLLISQIWSIDKIISFSKKKKESETKVSNDHVLHGRAINTSTYQNTTSVQSHTNISSLDVLLISS